MAFKRSRSTDFTAYADVEDIRIVVAGREQPLCAQFSVLRQFSTCVRDLPRNADEPAVWDLQQLVLEGDSGPVSAEVVELWLDAIYCRVDAARRAPPIGDLNNARALLIFADACGTSQVVISEIERYLTGKTDLSLAVTCGQGQQQLTVSLLLRNAVYYIHSEDKDLCFLRDGQRTEVVGAQQFAPHAHAFRSAVCGAVESWLHLSGRLGMVELCRTLINFVKLQFVASTVSILWSGYERIFSRRVLECMPRELLYEALVRDGLMDRPASIHLEAKGVKVTLSSPAAAAWFQKRAGAVEQLNLDGKKLTGFGTSMHMHTVVGGLPAETAPAVIERIVASAMAKPEGR